MKGRNEAGANADQQQLPARRGDEIDDLIDAVERAAVGVARLGVDPGFGDRVDAGEDEAERAARDHPRGRRDRGRHQDHGDDASATKAEKARICPARRTIAGAASVPASMPAK